MPSPAFVRPLWWAALRSMRLLRSLRVWTGVAMTAMALALGPGVADPASHPAPPPATAVVAAHADRPAHARPHAAADHVDDRHPTPATRPPLAESADVRGRDTADRHAHGDAHPAPLGQRAPPRR
ncbi:hypothetical protein SAMN05444365_109110 [Micromonospora pattaloongensis]|uniref:Uncharacterized protein n=1 Tax=Micromonospora pattaloongensis TaxID=405436 RepID=A0A1H3RV09_9ACTN|nr:hypothetical protein [Micromonospora pattaloongensis]SDZ29564.1 hypothetical protein SAMN05444365_109110 [Micromonospora pattaloongensis]